MVATRKKDYSRSSSSQKHYSKYHQTLSRREDRIRYKICFDRKHDLHSTAKNKLRIVTLEIKGENNEKRPPQFPFCECESPELMKFRCTKALVKKVTRLDGSRCNDPKSTVYYSTYFGHHPLPYVVGKEVQAVYESGKILENLPNPTMDCDCGIHYFQTENAALAFAKEFFDTPFLSERQCDTDCDDFERLLHVGHNIYKIGSRNHKAYMDFLDSDDLELSDDFVEDF